MDTRVCARCGKKKEVSEFSWKIAGKRKHSYCKNCHKEYRKDHYHKNKSRCLANVKRWNAKRREELFEFLYDYLSEHPCVDCGESDVVVPRF